jgi:hypothetical protein
MSRYTKKIGHLEYAWGYDRPLQEYFFSCEDLSKGDEDDNPFIFSIASRITLKPHPDFPDKQHYSNGEILEVMNKYPGIVKEEHLDAIAMDLQF